MPVRVVKRLEPVDVDHEDRADRPRAFHPVHFLLQYRGKVSPVVQPRQGVRDGKLTQFLLEGLPPGNVVEEADRPDFLPVVVDQRRGKPDGNHPPRPRQHPAFVAEQPSRLSLFRGKEGLLDLAGESRGIDVDHVDFPDHLLPGIPGDLFRPGVEEEDVSLLVVSDDAVRARLEDRLEQVGSTFPLVLPLHLLGDRLGHLDHVRDPPLRIPDGMGRDGEDLLPSFSIGVDVDRAGRDSCPHGFVHRTFLLPHVAWLLSAVGHFIAMSTHRGFHGQAVR